MKKKHLAHLFVILTVFFAASFAFAGLQIGDELAAFDAGEKISLDLKGMDIIEVLKTLASKGKMNLVVGANVRGRVTMFLKDVNIGEAFEIILAANNLAKDRRGSITYVMTQRDYEQIYGEKYGDKKKARIIQLKYAKASDISKAINQIKTKIGKVIVDDGSNTIVIIDAPEPLRQAVELVAKLDKPTSTIVFELNYASTADIKDKIQEVLTKNVGSVQVDERTNKILVTDLKDRMGEIGKIIRAFDTKPQQVLIDAKIMEITLTDEFKLGIDWETVLTEFQDSLKHPIAIRSGFSLAAAGGLSPGGEIVLGSFGTGQGATLIQMLKTIGDVNTLSNPRITVLNNEEAKILIGDSEPYAINTVTQGNTLTTTGTELAFMEIGIKLYVTPTINRNGFVTMKIKPEVSSTTRNYTYGTPPTTVPIVSTTQAETSVSIKDGHTIIIAGLIKDDRSDTVSEVPFLGDIPIFGWAFKRSVKTVQKKELVIFITVHIISGETDILDVPETPPLNEMKFTVPEEPTFYKRRPVLMSPKYLWGKTLKEKKAMVRERVAAAAPRPSSEDEYSIFVKSSILENLMVSEENSYIKKGDRAEVFFRLYSGGNLATKPRVIKTTNEYFSDAVAGAITRSAPFPAFPLSMRDFRKDFTLDIIYDPADENRERSL